MFTFVNAKSCMGSKLSEINSWKKNSLRALKYRASTLESGASSCTCPVVTQVTDSAYRVPSQQQDTEQDSSVLLSCWSLSLALLTSHCDTPTAVSEVSASLDKQRGKFSLPDEKATNTLQAGLPSLMWRLVYKLSPPGMTSHCPWGDCSQREFKACPETGVEMARWHFLENHRKLLLLVDFLQRQLSQITCGFTPCTHSYSLLCNV